MTGQVDLFIDPKDQFLNELRKLGYFSTVHVKQAALKAFYSSGDVRVREWARDNKYGIKKITEEEARFRGLLKNGRVLAYYKIEG